MEQYTLFDGKVCLKCRLWKPLAEFGMDRNRDDGRYVYCKRCKRKNPDYVELAERMKAAGLKRCYGCKQWIDPAEFPKNKSCPGGLHHTCKACARARAVDYKQRNLEKVRATQRAYKPKPRNREVWLDWYTRNHDRILANRRSVNAARKLDEETGGLTGAEWVEIIKSQGGKCGICRRPFGKDLRPTRDHIIPYTKGGRLTKENTGALCHSCNARRGNRDTTDYRLLLMQSEE